MTSCEQAALVQARPPQSSAPGTQAQSRAEDDQQALAAGAGPGGAPVMQPPPEWRPTVSTDDTVQATHVDAALAKASCARLGYFEDRWTEQLIRNTRPMPRAPLIHRGYYSRVKAMRAGLLQFLDLCPAGGGCPQARRARSSRAPGRLGASTGLLRARRAQLHAPGGTHWHHDAQPADEVSCSMLASPAVAVSSVKFLSLALAVSDAAVNKQALQPGTTP